MHTAKATNVPIFKQNPHFLVQIVADDHKLLNIALGAPGPDEPQLNSHGIRLAAVFYSPENKYIIIHMHTVH